MAGLLGEHYYLGGRVGLSVRRLRFLKSNLTLVCSSLTPLAVNCEGFALNWSDNKPLGKKSHPILQH